MNGRHAPADDYCLRCGSDTVIDYGAHLGCGHCGANWQTDWTLTERPRNAQVAQADAEPRSGPRGRYRSLRRLDKRTELA